MCAATTGDCSDSYPGIPAHVCDQPAGHHGSEHRCSCGVSWWTHITHQGVGR